jgi:HD-GYP domain-containing protein (c-di-GMP phosphodiesterase class II)
VKSIDGISEEIVNMVSTHHERNDGSGYPHGLKQDEIPLFGKMAGIIDCYDAIISNRPHAEAISPHDAVKKLYSWSGKDFQTELIEQFIQVVGVYPVGTLVVLSDGRVGVVTAHNKVRRLRPKVMLILDKEKQQYNRFKGIDLLKDTEGEDGQPLNIVKAVNPSFYGIDPGQYYF